MYMVDLFLRLVKRLWLLSTHSPQQEHKQERIMLEDSQVSEDTFVSTTCFARIFSSLDRGCAGHCAGFESNWS